jgi:prolipoprotein diacylglyceryltransferase
MWMYWKKNAGERPGLIFGTFLIGTFLSRFFIEFIKNDQVAFEESMTLNMGQCLSIPFVLMGIVLIIYSMTRPRLQLQYPNRFADEKADKKSK